jgi:hypothetical protein
MRSMPPSPIFVVGAPRSGTTLLASMLAGHSRVACGPETQFFNKLSEKRLLRAVRDSRWPNRAVELVKSLTLAEQPVHTLFGHTPEELRTFLAAREPSAGVVLEALTALYAAKRNKPRWAEKTPNHLLHLPRLRRHYPDAPIVRIVRDPRDCALSMRKLPWTSPSVLANSYLWAAWFRESQPFFEHDANTFTLRYEDLIAEPETTLRRLCAFVGEPFEMRMLETRRTGRNVSSPNETWKAANARALDVSRTGVWSRELDAATQEAVSYSCLAGLEAFGYPCPRYPTQTARAYPLDRYAAETHEAALLQAARHGVRIQGSTRPSREKELLILPSAGGPHKQRLQKLIRLGALLIARRLQGKTTYYLRPEREVGSWAQSVALSLSRRLGRRYSA